ncbi:GerMN domain-containing protein [Serpentinicella sp. ANB-PHB4]|uniref:GerMN domain-containing protein n=1 Tax=Serpentinicella sp. ANB-PHB4 TaxID=3074076 RepID=UPI00285DD23F|nr:GerMN domain-containing protein [Serpentinicella sp. ANB-PHB4]MDR5660088.1 GerMN domain-containing protein [Serpentinicella sp. ANB-PHB4]
MIKKISAIVLVLGMLVVLVGCGTSEDPQKNINDEKDNDNVIVNPEPEGDQVTVTLYFVNQEYVYTGDADLDPIVPVEREVALGSKTVEEVVITELQKEPGDEDLTTALEVITLLSVETEDNIAYVNISGDQLGGGSMQEGMILSQIVWTLTEIEDIDAVQILVDGSKRESLMGHITIDEPLSREEI